MSGVKCVLNFDQFSYKPGQTIRCFITLTFNEELTYRNISVRFLGESATEFSKRTLSTFKHRFAKYTGSQEHFRWYKDVISSNDEGDTTMQPGTYKYEVNYTLPYGIPSTFHGKYGNIRYTASITIDKLFREDNTFRKEFIVETPIDPHDLHLYASYLAPLQVENSIDFCCCGCRPSSLAIRTTTTSGRFETGQVIPLTVECRNVRNIRKFKLDIKLYKIVSFHSTVPVTEIKRDTEMLSRLTLSNTDKFDTKTWAGKLKVPFIEIPNVQRCAIIDVKFVIRTTANVNGSLHNIELNEIMLLIEPGEPIVHEDANEKLAPVLNKMEEFDSLMLYNGDESPPLGYSETLF